MKKLLLTALIFSVYQIARCQQTVPNSFECRVNPGYNEFTAKQITSFICKSQFENFRLLDKRDTLTFDNGFCIILYSATELQKAGLISNAVSYQSKFPSRYTLPVFHINAAGEIAAAYPVRNDVKYSRKRN
jgi:hypothetical protein